MKKRIRFGRIILILVIFLFIIYSANYVYNSTINSRSGDDYVIAVVEGETIMNSDVELLIEGIPKDSEKVINKKLFLNQTIFNTLIDLKVIESNISINNETYKLYFQDYLDFLRINESEFKEAFDNDEEALNEFKKMLTAQIKRDIFIRKNVVPNVSVSEEEISLLYEENKENLEQYNFSEVKEYLKAQIILVKQRELIRNYFEEMIIKSNFKVFLFDDACKTEELIYYYDEEPLFESNQVLLVKKSDIDLVSFCYKNIPTNTIIKEGFYKEIDDLENLNEIISEFR